MEAESRARVTALVQAFKVGAEGGRDSWTEKDLTHALACPATSPVL